MVDYEAEGEVLELQGRQGAQYMGRKMNNVAMDMLLELALDEERFNLAGKYMQEMHACRRLEGEAGECMRVEHA